MTVASMNELPQNWFEVELQDLVENPKQDIVDGPFGSNLKASEYVDSGVPVFKIQNIKANRFVDKKINYITEDKAEELSRHSFISGDLIITKLGDPLGLCCKVPDKYTYGIIVADLMRFRPSPKVVVTKFLIHAINSVVVQNQFKAITKGTTRPRVNLTIVRGITLYLPPLPEQRAIVAKIEQLFSELDNGIANFKTAMEQLKVYRQAVLKKAFEGELTKAWRAKQTDLPTAEELLEQIRVEREKAAKVQGKKFKVEESLTDNKLSELPQLPQEWKWVTFSTVGYWTGGGTPSKAVSNYWDNGDVLWISPKDMKSKVVTDTIDKITTAAVENSSAKYIEAESVLFVVRSGILRRILPIALTNYRSTVNQDLQALTPIKVNADYIYWYSIANEYDIRQKCAKDGTTVESIETSSLKSYHFPLCALLEQHQIVQEIESRLSVCDKVEETIKDSLEKAEALRQSILKKAFEGKLLTEQELEACRQQPDWEPAEKLLERIKKEGGKVARKSKKAQTAEVL